MTENLCDQSSNLLNGHEGQLVSEIMHMERKCSIEPICQSETFSLVFGECEGTLTMSAYAMARPTSPELMCPMMPTVTVETAAANTIRAPR